MSESKHKYFLQQLGFLNAEINALQEEHDSIKGAFIKSTDYTTERVDSSKTNPNEMKLIRLTEKSALIDEKIDELVTLKIKASELFDLIDNQKFRIILREHYINGKDLKEIADILHYGERHTQRLHGYALLEFEKVYNKVIVEVI